MNAVLSLQGLTVALPRGADRPEALRQVSLDLNAGEILCVVGESGSGKSMMASAIMRLLPGNVRITGGSILFEGKDLASADEATMRALRGARIAMVFQEPMTALNPLRSIGDQIAEMFRIHTSLSTAEIEARVLALLDEVRIPHPAEAARAFPHELSGGQRQRAMIAMALALDPVVLIADEPTTALDVTTQAQILALIRDLQRRKGTAVLFITHDFGVVAEIADRVAVMQHGLLVEQGSARDVLHQPQHDYTKALIAAVPPLKAPTPRAISSESILVLEGRLAWWANQVPANPPSRAASHGWCAPMAAAFGLMALICCICQSAKRAKPRGACRWCFRTPMPHSTRAGARGNWWRRAR